MRPTPAKLRPTVGRFGRNWPPFGRVWPRSAKHWPKAANSGRAWPNIGGKVGLHRPTFGQLRGEPRLPEQPVGNRWASVRQFVHNLGTRRGRRGHSEYQVWRNTNTMFLARWATELEVFHFAAQRSYMTPPGNGAVIFTPLRCGGRLPHRYATA